MPVEYTNLATLKRTIGTSVRLLASVNHIVVSEMTLVQEPFTAYGTLVVFDTRLVIAGR